ncbi:uncharacterized protein E1O_06620 [Burkholderiales bacterium GJ-E10]|nr:uncharacterized protein E1O_06620 [Burkholderiales bacterium GJ-E10]
MHGIAHMIVSSLVHGLIYGAIFKTFRALSLPEVLMSTIPLLDVPLVEEFDGVPATGSGAL